MNNIINNLKKNNIFTDNEYNDISNSIYNTIKCMILDNIENIMKPDFIDKLIEQVKEIHYEQLSEIYSDNVDIIKNEIDVIILNELDNIYRKITPMRSYKKTFIRKIYNKCDIDTKINYVKNIPQPEQRTPEWYLFRHNLLTASSIWKVFGTQSSQNQLIYEKCQPFNIEKFNNPSPISLTSPLHWGQKYEPVSVEYYEKLYNTKVGDFGCIQHEKYKCIGASPDGIVIDRNSDIYGRMLEIKNIVNRPITGIPKIEYWIQMQLQMETCDLNECDFLETKFVEYNDEDAFNLDGTFQKTVDDKQKGIMVLFSINGKPYYEYAPINCSKEDYEIWCEKIMKKHENNNWIQNIYWKLDIVSCVLVQRNKTWFNKVLPKITNIWETIENERKTGYSHRAAKKRSRDVNDTNINNNKILVKKDHYNN